MWNIVCLLFIIYSQTVLSLLTCGDIKTIYNDADCTCASKNPTCLGAFNTTRYNILEQRVNALENLLAGLNQTLLDKIINVVDVMSVQ